jgi:hypothetical protein
MNPAEIFNAVVQRTITTKEELDRAVYKCRNKIEDEIKTSKED